MDKFTRQAAELLAQLTLEEKLDLTIGADAWHTHGVPRLGIAPIMMTDGPHGVRKATESTMGEGERSVPATCFPTASALGCSWDPALLEEIGAAIGEECQAQDVQIILGPGVNMKRTPLCGRNFEYYSEDPLLAGELGAGLVRGVQSRGVGTSLKHYACNNQEWERMSISAEVDERPLREIYLRAFQRVVQGAKPWTVMCSYNRLSGTPAAEHRWLLSEVLKGEWGYEGAVISDWGAVDDKAASLSAGLDLEMPGPGRDHTARLAALVNAGVLSQAAVDAAALRVLQLILRGQAGKRPAAAFDADAHHALARRAAAECMVLLKNKDDILPLERAGLSKLALIGRFGEHPRYQGAGSSRVNPTRLDIPREEIARALGSSVELVYAEGYDADGATTEAKLAEAVNAARGADVAVILAGLPESYEAEGYDRDSMAMPEGHNRLIEAVCQAQPHTAVVLMNGSAVELPWFDAAPAVLEAGLGGQAVGGAIADVLFGVRAPGGRLAETWPLALRDTPAYINYPGEAGRVRYGEGLYIGYRYYDKKGADVRRMFGSGLAYTSFSYGALRLSAETLGAGGALTATIGVTNTGSRPSSEVVQLYVERPDSAYDRPPRELKAFTKLTLRPGETHSAQLRLAADDLLVWDTARSAWYLEPGTCVVSVLSQAAEFEVLADPHAPRLPFTRLSTIRQFALEPTGLAALKAVLNEVPFSGGDLPPQEQRMMAALPIGKLVQFGILTEERLQELLDLANGG
ncbi:MAG: glycoside hydrolase family 3 C-terminal domain-containing protein [Chloroflexi bacterium]|nr:glycoside hydrolase family 3 C-terminal domain-containing protein [Chloroflexota bacterium]